MRRRVRDKISKQMLKTDAIISILIREGRWSEARIAQSYIRYLRRRWKRIYIHTFLFDHFPYYLRSQ